MVKKGDFDFLVVPYHMTVGGAFVYVWENLGKRPG